MDIVEKKFRDTPVGNKKYLKRLNDYIRELMDKGRIIEAKYYFSTLYACRPDHSKTQIIGYELAIQTFDNDAVLLFDKALLDKKFEEQKLLSLRMRYYYSVNNTKLFSEVIEDLFLIKNLKSEVLELIVQLTFFQEAYKPVAIVINHLKSKNMVLHKMMESKLKPIVMQQLMNSIIEAKNENIFSRKSS